MTMRVPVTQAYAVVLTTREFFPGLRYSLTFDLTTPPGFVHLAKHVKLAEWVSVPAANAALSGSALTFLDYRLKKLKVDLDRKRTQTTEARVRLADQMETSIRKAFRSA